LAALSRPGERSQVRAYIEIFIEKICGNLRKNFSETTTAS
jgi:hypothetical protein